MDLLLPDADGLNVVKQIRASGSSPAPKIVVCTAAVMGDVRARARAAHVDMFLPKPCDLSMFGRQIRQLLPQAHQLS